MPTLIERNLPSHAADLAHWELVTVQPATRSTEAARILCQHKISGAPVTDAEGHVLGVVTQADIAKAVGANAPSAWTCADYHS